MTTHDSNMSKGAGQPPSDAGITHVTPNTWGKAPIELLLDQEISAGAVRLYAYMHWRYGQNKRNFEGQESMADALHVTKRTILNWLAELEGRDWIIALPRFSNTGRQLSNFYHVFETQDACREWRKAHPKAGVKTASPQEGVKSSSPLRVKKSSPPGVKQVSHNPDSVDPDSDEPDSKDSGGAAPRPVQPHIALIDAYWNALPGGRPIGDDYPRHLRIASAMVKAGVTPDLLTEFLTLLYDPQTQVWDYKRWHDTIIPLEEVAKLYKVWIAHRPTPRGPEVWDFGDHDSTRRQQLEALKALAAHHGLSFEEFIGRGGRRVS